MRLLLVSEGEHESSGALEALVRRLLPDGEHECTFKNIRDLRGGHGKGPRYFKKVVTFLHFAARNGYEALVLVVDEDGDRSRRRQFDDAQEHSDVALPRAIGLAIPTFDAWMLADERALSRALGCIVQRQPDPEQVPSPKQLCERLHADSRCEVGLREVYATVASLLDLDVLRRRCPDGFGVFARRVCALAGAGGV